MGRSGVLVRRTRRLVHHLLDAGRCTARGPAGRQVRTDGSCVWVGPLAALAFSGAGIAAAQGLPANPPLPPVPGATAPKAPDAGGEPPYEPQLERLAERLGTLALLRDLCGEGDAAEFRSRMAALLDAEAASPERRSRLAGAFNRGFRGYAASYHSCTPSARTVISRALAEADRLTRDLASRYGGT